MKIHIGCTEASCLSRLSASGTVHSHVYFFQNLPQVGVWRFILDWRLDGDKLCLFELLLNVKEMRRLKNAKMSPQVLVKWQTLVGLQQVFTQITWRQKFDATPGMDRTALWCSPTKRITSEQRHIRCFAGASLPSPSDALLSEHSSSSSNFHREWEWGDALVLWGFVLDWRLNAVHLAFLKFTLVVLRRILLQGLGCQGHSAHPHKHTRHTHTHKHTHTERGGDKVQIRKLKQTQEWYLCLSWGRLRIRTPPTL